MKGPGNRSLCFAQQKLPPQALSQLKDLLVVWEPAVGLNEHGIGISKPPLRQIAAGEVYIGFCKSGVVGDGLSEAPREAADPSPAAPGRLGRV